MKTFVCHCLVVLSLVLIPPLAAPAATTAQTDLASITVTPLPRQTKDTAAWQTIYNYAGGEVLPPGTRIMATGKSIDPEVRKDAGGVTFGFPKLPSLPQAAQFLEIGFSVERPIADYPTRATIQYTSSLDQVLHERAGWWSAFQLTTADYNFRTLIGQLRGVDPAATDALPIHPTGANTLVCSFDAQGAMTVTSNDQEATAFFSTRTESAKPGALLFNGLTMRNKMEQLPENTGDWFAINSFKIEQMRPPLDSSAAATVDLTVPGTAPIRATIEVVNDQNEGIGYVLRDALVSPGQYRLYWDGIEQKQSRPVNSTWAAAGSYTFHLTTSKTEVHFAGEINNSTPKFNALSYAMVDCTAVALTPPGTPAISEWTDMVNREDKRKLDTTDSMQLLCVGYDSKWGQWVGTDGTVIHTKMGTSDMQHGRSLAVTPPDPSDASDPAKQFFFASKSIGGGYSVISTSFPTRAAKTLSKTLSSPDWNRPPPASWPYKIKIGQVPYMPGQQHFLTFEMSQTGKNEFSPGDWIFRNVRLYEEGSPEPKPIAFDQSLFTPRATGLEGSNTPSIPAGGVTVEDAGLSVHMKNAICVNYPFDYNITPHTILAFDLQVINRGKLGQNNGIGLDSQTSDVYPKNEGRFFNFFGGGRDPGRFGFYEPALGAYEYPVYEPNTLYTDSVPVPPAAAPYRSPDTSLLWQPGFYGLKISEDGKLLFACNNADNRLEVRDISTDGSAIVKIPLDSPMYVTWAPDGTAGAPAGTRFVYVDSLTQGIVRIPWHVADNTFGKPDTLTPSTEFAYPRGLDYSAKDNRLFVCDAFTLDRAKAANQIAVIDPQSGKVLSRFGKPGGVDPKTGGVVNDEVFTCPLTIAVDSKGALWVNDYYLSEVRKYNFSAGTNQFTLERRVLGPNYTNISQFYWMPGGPPTTVWTVASFFTRNEADIGADGLFTNQRTTSTTYQLAKEPLRPYSHFTRVGDHVYGTFAGQDEVYEQVDDGWVTVARIGNGAGEAAREAGLLAKPGEPPTDLDKAITASGDADWEKRPYLWSDLNGDGKIEYTASNPEFQIAFGSNVVFDGYIPPSACLRSPDGAYVRTAKDGIAVIPATLTNGRLTFSWQGAKVIPRTPGPLPVSDVVAQDGHYYALRISTQRHDVGEKVLNKVECYDDAGKLLWTRSENDFSIVNLQSVGDGLISVMDRAWSTDGPIYLRNSDGELISQAFCREAADCWANSALRVDPDTAYLGLVQAYKVTGLATAKSATATVAVSAASP